MGNGIGRHVAWLVLVLSATPAPTASEDPSPKPPESGLVERAERRLVQLDVTVTGPPEVLRSLVPSDFELVVGGRPIESLFLDRLCPAALADGASDGETEEPEAPAAAAASTSYLFYFDQFHLTQAGRQRGLEVAHDLVDRLITGGSRGMVLSNALELRTFAELGSDPAVLHDALERLENDKKQWNPWSMLEDEHLNEILDLLDRFENERALALARRYQKEERWQTDKSLRRLALALGRLGDQPPPRVVVYFADTMRANAGEHYAGLFSRVSQQRESALVGMGLDSLTAALPFQGVIEAANAVGIRFYTVEAQGLTSNANVRRGSRYGMADPAPAGRRLRDSQDSLVSLARESGGRSFLHGVPAPKIANAIRGDLDCMYLLSFDAGGLPQDSPLPVLLRTKNRDVKTHVRGQLVVRSESALLQARLLSAFGAPAAARSEIPLSNGLVPTGFTRGHYTALVQLWLPGSEQAANSWDLGLSLVSAGKVREDASGRVAVDRPAVPIVFETEMTFAPGPYEVVAVAHQQASDAIASASLAGTWPDPDDAAVTVIPVAVLQAAAGAFLRGESVRRSGALVVPEDRALASDRATALVTLVCRDEDNRRPLEVERELVGDSSVPFDPLQLEWTGERCAQVRDVIPASVMSAGLFRYEVRVLSAKELLASSSRRWVIGDAPPPPVEQP